MASYTPLKVVVYLFNFLLMLCGLALIVGGTTFQIYYNDYLSGLEPHLYIAPILFIIVGVVIFFIAILSCFGTCKVLPWALIVVAILLSIVFLAEIAGSVSAYVERRSVYHAIERRMNDTLSHIPIDTEKSPEFKVWERLQNEFKCCGVTGYGQWLTSTQSKKIPKACCKNKDEPSCAKFISNPNSGDGMKLKCDSPGDINVCPIYTNGCLLATEEFVRNNIAYVGYVGLGVIAFQILGVVLLALLAKRIRNDATI